MFAKYNPLGTGLNPTPHLHNIFYLKKIPILIMRWQSPRRIVRIVRARLDLEPIGF